MGGMNATPGARALAMLALASLQKNQPVSARRSFFAFATCALSN
jgi:hypothetical protein